MHDTGLITLPSSRSVRDTMNRLVAAVTSKGMLVFARIDHAANAKEVGISMRPTELLIFGNPKGGSPLMVDQQTIGIDLPVKAAVWEDAESRVWLTYNDAEWMAQRHGLSEECLPVIKVMSEGMALVANEACGT